jgi:hypothetical protein
MYARVSKREGGKGGGEREGGKWGGERGGEMGRREREGERGRRESARARAHAGTCAYVLCTYMYLNEDVLI